ncbi:MAG: hypothetical protein Q9160_005671 [Pyrenula sp. 1 TL-2023]
MFSEAISIPPPSLVVLLLSVLLPAVHAQSTITSSASPAATSNTFPLTTSGSNPPLNPATAPGDPTDPNSESAQNAAGAEGGSSGGVDLSTGTIVAICVVVGVVVILGVSSAILFYLAKKRQWAVRASLRRSARRVTSTLRHPMTPRTRTTFANLDKQQPKSSSSGGSRSPPQTKPKRQQQASPQERQQRQDQKSAKAIARAKEAVARDSAGSVGDVEKGFGTRTVIAPESRFDMDSPEMGGRKGRWWGFGGKKG